MKNLSLSPLENNELPIFPAFFFPNIEYLFYLNMFNEVFLESCESFPKQTFRNRAYILSANGKLSINIPILKEKSYRQTTSEVMICYKDNWNMKAWKAINSAYGNSPFFEYYEEEIKHFFTNKYEKLFDLNCDILLYFQKRFEIRTTINITENYNKNINLDFRNKFIPQLKDANKSSKTIYKNYIQCFSDKFGFIENLSCIDLLFNMGNESINYIKNSSLK